MPRNLGLAGKTFWGLVQEAINADCDMVIIAAAGIPSDQYAAAIAAGKRSSWRSPAVDTRLSAGRGQQMAGAKGLKVGVGLQRATTPATSTGSKKSRGKYGDLICLQAYWNSGGIWWQGQEGWTG